MNMSKFHTITVCTDFSFGALAAVERAAQLAMEHGATLCLLQAHGVPHTRSSSAMATDPLNALGEHMSAEVGTLKAQQRLAESASDLASRTGLRVESVLGMGPAHAVIREHIELRRPSLVVLGARFDITLAGIGGTVLKLMRSPGCPVLIVRNTKAGRYEHVLSAVDLRDSSVRAAVVALDLYPQSHHHLLYAVAPALDISLEAGGISADQVQSLHLAMHQNAKRELLLLAKGFSTRSTHPVSAKVADDVPARAVLVGAASLQADCVVVGHHGAEEVGQTELGSMALHVLQFIPSDVLVVP